MKEKTRMNRVHVVPHLLGWAIKVNGRQVSWFTTQAKAELCASFLGGLMAPATVKFHSRLGKIKEERTFSQKDDPPETPG